MGMAELDSRLSLTLYTKCLGIPRAILEALELMGDGRLWFALVPALYVGHPDPNIRYICFNILTGLLLDLIIISLIKAIIKRPRPSYNKGMTIVVSVDKWSFPSGHSSRAFFIATIFYIFYHDGGFMGEIFHHIFMGFHHIVGVVVAWAVATSASRILLGRHYVFDVGAGALVGVLQALAVYHFLIVSPRFTEVVRGFVIGYPCSFRGYFPQFLAGLCKSGKFKTKPFWSA